MFSCAIDPGHGGSNLGAIYGSGSDQVVEKEYTLEIAHLVLAQCQALGLEALLTRSQDETVSLEERGHRAKNVDFVLSIHCNAHADGAVRGFMSFCWPHSYEGRVIAQSLARGIPEQLYRPSERVYIAIDGVDWLKAARNVLGAFTAPAVLAEIGHISNSFDRRYLNSHFGKLAIANSLTAGIIRAYELLREKYVCI
jgi:N-acetylmuramoyl-L-alanine amidase